jgi:hypothetical protein
MPIRGIKSGADFVELNVGGTVSKVLEGDVAGVGTKEEIAAAFVPFLQDQLDVRQKLNTLPSDDPDRSTDPAQPFLFWDGPGQPGNTDLVSRSVIVEDVVWNGSVYVVTLRRAQ